MIQYPDNITNNSEKYQYVYDLLNKLIVEHNQFAQKKQNGELTEQEFLNYKTNRFKKLRNQIIEELLLLRPVVERSLSTREEKVNYREDKKNNRVYNPDLDKDVSIRAKQIKSKNFNLER